MINFRRTQFLLFTGCDFITKLTEHEIVVEDNADEQTILIHL